MVVNILMTAGLTFVTHHENSLRFQCQVDSQKQSVVSDKSKHRVDCHET